MELGIHIVNFSFPGAPSTIAAAVGDMVAAAEDIGVTHISVMDHWFQMEMMGSAAMEMLESYTTLGYIAARTKKARLGVLVTGVTYRPRPPREDRDDARRAVGRPRGARHRRRV